MTKSNVNTSNHLAVEHDPWAGLHRDLLDEITKYVDSYKNYVRIRAVCKQWHFQLPQNPKYIKNLWLVLPFYNEEEILRPFLNIGENKVCYLELPETRNTIFRGSYYEWLITVAIDGTVRMLNPFTRVHVDLPPFSAFPNVIDYHSDIEEYNLCVTAGKSTMHVDKVHMQKLQISKLIIASQPEQAQDFMALAIYGVRHQLCYCRLGDNNWTDFEDFGLVVEDATFYEGKVYAVHWKTQLFEISFDAKGVSREVIPVAPLKYKADCYGNCFYLVGTPIGLLMVRRQLDAQLGVVEEGVYYKTYGFEVYKLSRDEAEITWSRVNNLGDYVLLLGYNSSMCMLADTLVNAKANRIYFTDSKSDFHYARCFGGQDIGVFNLEDDSFDEFFPNFERLFPVPVWLLR